VIIGKVWGTTECMLQTPLVEIHRLVINPKHQCSLHVHHRKWNAFIVIHGQMFVDVVKNDYSLTDTTELNAGEVTSVKPGEHHRFRTGSQSCEAFEIYYTEALSDDISRKGVGGLIDEVVVPDFLARR
jgi:mannose-6-phosphate isomerase-like protein (cupin superfamily)